MTNEQKVAEFMDRACQQLPERPTIPPSDVRELRMELICEELAELQFALAEFDLDGIADAIGDLLYVVYGAGIAFGLPVQEIFDEVHRSNMSKFIDGHRRPDGKWMKGPSYSPPNLKAILERHSNPQPKEVEI